MEERNREWEFHLRSLSNYAADPASDPSVLNSITRLCELCKSENSEELIARVYPHLNKIFQRSVASISKTQTSNGLLLLVILQFFLDFGDVILHDADPSLRTFFRSCLSREFADPHVAEKTLEFLNVNKGKLLKSFPTLLPQFFPLMLKLIAWNGEKYVSSFHILLCYPPKLKLLSDNYQWILEKLFVRVFGGFISPGSFIPLFPSLIDLPNLFVVHFLLAILDSDIFFISRLVLVVALEKVERSSGSLVGSSIASIQKSAAPEMLLALMDEAYTGSIGDGGADSESEDSTPLTVDPIFLTSSRMRMMAFLYGTFSERHWTSPGMTAVLQAVVNSPQSGRLKEALKIAPQLLDFYFASAVHDANESLLCALIPLLMARYSSLFPEKIFSYEVQRRLVEFMLAAFHRSPHFIALLKKPIVNRLGEAYDNPAKTELALQLCWAIGEHGGGGGAHKDAARELFESLELLLYENLSSSHLGLGEASHSSGSSGFKKSSQSRLLCFVVTALAKLATYHRELLPRVRVSLAKVARTRISDARVWRHAQDCLSLMNEPAVCMSILGPVHPSSEVKQYSGIVNWDNCSTKMIAHIPFYILGGLEGPPFHDFSFEEIIPRK
ncbi:hypothetical protein F511_25936 [Dorcoceras hygrometricum]|uniref:AP-5 complex subunit zeta-1 n=1 Tax=Dorcoceras hygrometricum TaxID=472368 RepID=A0A2Z7BBE7_9LAMI|nr:hypothetical protein F511_25936 [Dorcoceras hygrometricum]